MSTLYQYKKEKLSCFIVIFINLYAFSQSLQKVFYQGDNGRVYIEGYAPAISPDGDKMIYASHSVVRSDGLFEVQIWGDSCSKPKKILENFVLNEIPNFPFGSCCLTDQVLFFTVGFGNYGTSRFETYYAVRKDSAWQIPVRIPHLTIGGISASKDGSRLFFEKRGSIYTCLWNRASNQISNIEKVSIQTPRKNAWLFSPRFFPDSTLLFMIEVDNGFKRFKTKWNNTGLPITIIEPDLKTSKAQNYYTQTLGKDIYVAIIEDKKSFIYYQKAKNDTLKFTMALKFASNSYQMDSSSYKEIDNFIAKIKYRRSSMIAISAHTDDIGSHEQNQVLSEKRAKAVADYLINKGVESSQIISKGMGETQPLYPNDSETNRAKNRRVEFIIYER